MNDSPPIESLSRAEYGALGEELAAQYLSRQGWEILERNFESKYGEIDIIAQQQLEAGQGALVAFVEVKSRRSTAQNPPELSVTAQKRRTIVRVARFYADRNIRPRTGYRFDVIAVDFSKEPPNIDHFEGAFDASGNPY